MMEIVIKIDEEDYKTIKSNYENGFTYKPFEIIANGTPLPKGHGDLIDRDTIEVLRIGNIKREYDKGFDAGVTCMVDRILYAQPIIEAEGSESK